MIVRWEGTQTLAFLPSRSHLLVHNHSPSCLAQFCSTHSRSYRKAEWERLAEGLLEYETLTGEEIQRVIRGEPPHVNEDDDNSDAGSAPSRSS